MVGRAVVEHCTVQGDNVVVHDHRSLSITNERAVKETFEQACPEVVINCAAWTDVDGCEADPQRAQDVNAHGPELLAANCRRVGALLITISTDYVFDGTKEGFYTQRDDPNPASVYGIAKLAGERHAQSACARTIIVRTGWIFGSGGTNFLSRIVKLAEGETHLKAIGDAFGTPTYARDLAMRLRRLAELDLPGIYHVVNGGEGTSYEGFARAALSVAGHDSTIIEGVSMNALHRPAPRPRNSRLRCLVSEAIGLTPLPFWQDALEDFVAATARAGVPI